MIKRMIIMLLIFGSIVGVLAYFKYSQIKAGMSMDTKMPPEAVTSITIQEEVWPQTLKATGSLSPVQGVMTSSEEAGKIVKIAFKSNKKVRKDDLLIQLDISVEEAQLKAAEARAELARSNLERMQSLKGTSALPEKEIDDAQSQLKQTNAEVNQLKAVIDRKTIRAPFSGLTGIRQVQMGQYLSPGSPIVSLQTLNPIYADFSVPQQFLVRLNQEQKVQVFVDAFPSKTFEGIITAIDSEVDKSTRTVRVRAILENPDEKLSPGMFARVTVVFSEKDRYITVPSTAIQRAPYGDSVYVIEKMKTDEGRKYLGVRQQFVKLGPKRGDQVAVLEGLKAGEEIVTSGTFKLRPKAEVMVDNEITPENQPAPQPQDS